MIRINLLPVRAEKRKENLRKHFLFIIGYLACLAAVILSVHFSIVTMERNAKDRLEKVKKEIIEYEAKIKEVEGYKAKFADLADKIEIIKSLEAKQQGPAKVLNELALTVPEKIWVEKVSQDNGKFTIKGMAIDNQTIAKFMTDLENNPKFERVRLEVSKREEKGGVVLSAFSL
ncbi:hypothetical protein FDZ71_07810, partial [bacterium]